MENETVDNVDVAQSPEALSSALSDLRSNLLSEVKQRQAVIKPIENILSALKDPHRNAVALYEATETLTKADKDFISLANLDSTLNQLQNLAHDKLSDLEFSFARDLKVAFEEKGIVLDGPPHELVADLFVIKIDMRKRQVYINFSKQPVTDKKIKLDVDKVLSAYQRAKREICERNINLDELLKELFEAYQRVLKLDNKEMSTRMPIVDCYRELVLIKQPSSFRKSPSKLSFIDYPKTHFIFDMLQARQENKLKIDDYRLELGTSTIEVGADSTRALFLATSALQGSFIKDIHFSKEKRK